MSAGKKKLNLCFRNTAIHLHYKSGGATLYSTYSTVCIHSIITG